MDKLDVTSAGTTNYTYTPANELLSSTINGQPSTTYTYDANGNTVKKVTLTDDRLPTTEYTYDNKNQLVKATKPNGDEIEYTYDGNGNRYSKTITPSGGTANTRYYSYDTGGNIVSEYKRVILNGSEESQTLVRYVRDTGGKAISMINYEDRSSNNEARTFYFIYNGHGDVTALTDSTGTVVATYQYDEFGNITSSTGNIYNPLRYSGAHNSYYDTETGLYKMGTRYYQSDVGRWLTRDNYKGELQQLQSQNRYVYVENNPLTKVDPTGFKAWPTVSDKWPWGDDLFFKFRKYTRKFLKNNYRKGENAKKFSCSGLAVTILTNFAKKEKRRLVLYDGTPSAKYDSNNYSSIGSYMAKVKDNGIQAIDIARNNTFTVNFSDARAGDLLSYDRSPSSTWHTRVIYANLMASKRMAYFNGSIPYTFVSNIESWEELKTLHGSAPLYQGLPRRWKAFSR